MHTNIPDVTQKLKWTFWPTEYFSMDIKHFMAKNDPQEETKHYTENYQKRKKKDKNKSAGTNLYKLQKLFIILKLSNVSYFKHVFVVFKKIKGKLYNNYREKINWLEIPEMKFTYPKENQCTGFITC